MRLQWQDIGDIGARDALLLSLLMFLVAGAITHAMGHPLICKCGYFKLWHGGLTDAEVSQHVFDWYTLGHISRGVVIYAITWVFLQQKPALGLAILVSALFASLWEVVENTPLVAHSFALSTRVADYTGDSVVASIGDMLATLLGGVAAAILPIWCSALLIVGSSLLPHDNPWFVAEFFADW